MIRIKPKKSLKKLQESKKTMKFDERKKDSDTKAVKHGLRSSGVNAETKKKKKKGFSSEQLNKELPIKKIKNVLSKLNNEVEESPFPITIDLQKHIRLAPKNDSKLSLSKDSIEMIKQSDLGMFSSISSILDSGDKELGVDEMREKQAQKPKPYSGLPGWGNWANSRTINQAQVIPEKKVRQEEIKRKRVHIAELPSKNPHQIDEVPFPFVSVADYESSIRLNFSQEFNSRKVHQILSKSKKKVEMELDEK